MSDSQTIQPGLAPQTREQRICFGIFVGGKGQRMGGVAKGLLRTKRGESLVEHTLAACNNAEPNAPVVLIGQQPAYTELGLVQLDDDPPEIGPLGGLRALLQHAIQVGSDSDNDLGANTSGISEPPRVIALACDLPQIDAALLRRLIFESPEAAVLAPRLDGLWQPLCARYAPRRVLDTLDSRIAKGRYSLLGLLEQLGARCVELGLGLQEAHAVQDCDTPERAAEFGLRVDPEPE